MNNYSNQFYVSTESLLFLKEIQNGFPKYGNFLVTVVPTVYTGWLRRKDQFFFGCDSVGHCENNIYIYMYIITSNNIYIYILSRLIQNGYRDTAVWIAISISVRFLFVVLDEERSLQNKCGYTRRIVRSHFGCCCLHKKCEDQLRRTTRDLRTWVSKCSEVDGGICEHLFWTVTNLSFWCNKFCYLDINLKLKLNHKQVISLSLLLFTMLLYLQIQRTLS